MACSCKRVASFEEQHGIEEEETLLGKMTRNTFRVVFFLITIGLLVILVPIVLFAAIYNIFFGDNKITLPRFMRKYLQ